MPVWCDVMWRGTKKNTAWLVIRLKRRKAALQFLLRFFQPVSCSGGSSKSDTSSGYDWCELKSSPGDASVFVEREGEKGRAMEEKGQSRLNGKKDLISGEGGGGYLVNITCYPAL